jgi:hypothetical protein
MSKRLIIVLDSCSEDAQCSNVVLDTGYIDLIFRGFPQFYKTNARTVSQVGHDRFLPNSFPLIIHLSSYHSPLCSLATDSVVK